MDLQEIHGFLFSLPPCSRHHTRIHPQEDASKCNEKSRKWLGLTRSATTAIVHHPNVIDIPSISELHTKAKLTFLSAISVSQDPKITELGSLGRYAWRHDSALKVLVDGIKSGLPEARVLADLPGLRVEENPLHHTKRNPCHHCLPRHCRHHQPNNNLCPTYHPLQFT